MPAELLRRPSVALLLGLQLSCATPSPPPPETRDPMPLPPPSIAPRSVSRPDAAPRSAALRMLESTRFTLELQEAELRAVLLGLAKGGPLNVVVEPGVSGEVTADLADVSLLEILEELVEPRGYRWSLERNLLRIAASDVETRIYRVDYPSYLRLGRSDVLLSGFIGSMPDIGESGADTEESSLSSIETSQDSDFWGEMETTLRTLIFGSQEEEASEPGDADRRLTVSPQAGLVTVMAESSVLARVEDFLDALARSFERQVLIDAAIVEVTLSDDLDMGADYEIAPDFSDAAGVFSRLITPGLREASLVQDLAPDISEGSIRFGYARDEFGVILRALATQTDVRIVSTPRVATLNNHKALIKAVRNEVFFVAEVETAVVEGAGSSTATEFVPKIVPVGVTLDVTPQVSETDEITLHVRPSVSEIVSVTLQPTSDSSLPQTGSLPVIDLRETDTVLRVDDGQTIVIGGLIQSRNFEQERRVPLLGSIPLLGYAFRSTQTEEQRTELVIFLTPVILDAPRIVRLSADAERRLAEIEALRDRRSAVPWWRRPLGADYGALR